MSNDIELDQQIEALLLEMVDTDFESYNYAATTEKIRTLIASTVVSELTKLKAQYESWYGSPNGYEKAIDAAIAQWEGEK